MSTLNSKTHTSDESVLTDNMDLDSDTLDLATAAGIDNVGLDLKDLVESIYNDKNRIFDETFPESPPDSGSEHLLSPGQSSQHKMSPSNGTQFQESRIAMAHLDLSTIDYDVPLQILEQGQDIDPTAMFPKITMPYRGVVDSPSQVVLPLSQGGAVQFSPQRGCSPQVTIKNEVHSLSTPTTQPSLPKRKRKGSEVPASVHIKPEPNCHSPQPSQTLTNINFNLHEPHQWSKLLNKSKHEIKHPVLTVSADKGFNFSMVDDAFIAQKKNHFQLTCHIDMGREEPCFIKTKAGTIHPLRHLQMNFHGIKLDTPNSFIRVEQSQTDRTKIKFKPVIVYWKASTEPLQLVVGRLHFTETTANNMRKKGKPNPSQKYFQLVASLEATIHSQNQMDLPIVSLASERIIVRASNPGQFEPDSEASWMREQGSETIYHIGKVGINTDHASEALSVHGNIQLTGQILQPSDLRIKHNVKELDSRKQLQNVNKIKIVQYQYRPEFMEKLPDEQYSELIFGPQAGVIAQDVQRIIPDAVSSAGPFTLSDGKEINDMLIVNKERIFLENIGAVRELSKMTDHLENRLSDIESAHETVAVRLSRLRRGNSSIHSYSSSSSTGSTGEAPSHKGQKRFPSSRRRPATKHIFQNRCIQILLLVLLSITALSLTSMALVYTFNFSNSEHLDVEIEGVSFLNAKDNSLTGPALDPNLSLPNTLETPRTNVLIVQLSSDMELPEVEDLDGAKDDKQVVESTTTTTFLSDSKVIKVQDSFEDAIANEVLDKVKDNGIISSNPREVRLLKSQVVKEKKDDLEQVEKVIEEESEGNSTSENDIKKAPLDRSTTTESIPTNDLLVRDKNSKTFNEILAKAEDESNNSEPLDQRAKRNVLLKGHLRKIRTVEEPFDLQHSSEPSSSYPFPLLRTMTSEYDLDQQFCDPNDGFFWRCRDASGLPRNSSLAVPLSKYFRERSLQIVFASNNVVQCRAANSATPCGNTEPDLEIPSSIPGQ
eukprot:TCALIF_12676-PA protein Name:"Similar to Myrf Myelin regulatory factor (Mus musculus)" AED:0.19 eAED:0.19 QI:157/0.8/0.72/0.81/1/1/11/0/994